MGGRVRGSIRGQGAEYNFQYTVGIAQHFIVPEAKHFVTAVSQPSISNGVSLVSCMLTTIDFNDEIPLPANKIDDIWSNGILAIKFEPAERARSQPIPKL